MENPKVIAAIIGAVVLILIGSVWFFVFRETPTGNQEQLEQVLPEGMEVEPVEASVKVAIEPIENNRKVRLTIDNIPSKYKTIEYDLLYDAKDGVPRGVQGTITLDGSSYEKDIVLGSCSTNVCTYDEGVTEVKLTMRFSDGTSARVFDKTFPL